MKLSQSKNEKIMTFATKLVINEHLSGPREVLEIQNSKIKFLVSSGSQFTSGDRGTSTQDTGISAGVWKEVEWAFKQHLSWKVRSNVGWFILLIYQNFHRASCFLPTPPPKQNKTKLQMF